MPDVGAAVAVEIDGVFVELRRQELREAHGAAPGRAQVGARHAVLQHFQRVQEFVAEEILALTDIGLRRQHADGVVRLFFAAVIGLAPPDRQHHIARHAERFLDARQRVVVLRGKQLAAHYHDTLARIGKAFGVPGNVVLAIWGRETDYGGEKQPHDAIRVLATQAYVGKRKDFFRNEFLHALKMLQDGVPRADLRSSWGGAMGLTQFLPSEFYKYAVDFDGDGRADIWHSVPDALASAAKQLAGKGWQAGKPWAIEVRVRSDVDCTIAEPSVMMPVAEWLKRGYLPTYGRKLTGVELAAEASLLLPEGTYGPAFLTPKNYYVLKDYNYSDLYVLFVGHLSDRIAGGRPLQTPWSKNAQLKTSDVEAMQKRLTALALYQDKIDGKAGMLTRAALGAYQKKNGLKVDCWPTAAVLDHMRR